MAGDLRWPCLGLSRSGSFEHSTECEAQTLQLNRKSIAKLRPGALSHRIWLELAEADLRGKAVWRRLLDRRNRTETRSVLSANGPVVSMTTYGQRIESVYLTLESIASGTLLPGRLILWLDDERAFRSLPDSLRRLQARGLEVKLTENYGPHTKYYSYVASNVSLDLPLVTADDDTFYPSGWLRGLAEGFRSDPSLVTCYRAHHVLIEGDVLAAYVTWPRCQSTTPSVLYFATGVSGVIYPPALQQQLKRAGLEFTELCPKADDVWLHVQALRGGFKIRQLKPWEQSFPTLPGTQDTGLVQGNVHESQNDIQIRKTYTAADIALLQSALATEKRLRKT